MAKRILIVVLCIALLVALVGCDKKIKVPEEYNTYLAGKTFISGGSVMTFYSEGIATYDYNEHHYGYEVTVTEVTDTEIKLSLKTVVVQSDDYIERGAEEAVYNIADGTLLYYQEYACLFDPNNSDHFSNTAGSYNTVCAQKDCQLLIALSGHTTYCPEHAGECECCGCYVDPGKEYCPKCPACLECGKAIEPNTGWYCSDCTDTRPSGGSSSSSRGGKCIVCNGTGYVKYYYGSSDLEAYLNGYDPYTFGECTSCDGTGKD